MNLFWKITIVCIVIAATTGVIVLKNNRADEGKSTSCCGAGSNASTSDVKSTMANAKMKGPRLVDLGRKICIPCKAMAPILAELKTEYAGRLDVVFIDVSEDPSAAEPYNIQIIPTQVFFDASGKEIDRHEGFMSKEDILATFKKHRVDLAPATD